MEYFAFGETFVEEHRSSNNSPYKFNGKELDEETGWYYYGARYYNPRTSVWLSVDPLAEKYSGISPFAYVANNPINAIDPDSRVIIYLFKSGNETIYYEFKNGAFYNIKTGKIANYKDQTVTNLHMYRTQQALNQMKNSDDKVLKNQIDVLSKSDRRHIIKDTKAASFAGRVSWLNPKGTIKSIPPGYDKKEPYETLIQLDFSTTYMGEMFEGIHSSWDDVSSDFELVAHEISHAYEADTGTYDPTSYERGDKHNDPKEINATVNGNRARRIEGKNKETKYGGKTIDKQKLEKAEKASGY